MLSECRIYTFERRKKKSIHRKINHMTVSFKDPSYPWGLVRKVKEEKASSALV